MVEAVEIYQPTSVDELVDAVRDCDQILPVGNRTKPAMSSVDAASLVSMASLSGVVQYEPSEFTFTAWAGTPVREIVTMLQSKGQSLPFDPMLVGSCSKSTGSESTVPVSMGTGATIGGSIAAGISGPGRFRFGGLRDFLLGVELITGDAQRIVGGGKVVKNAAGFDIPKLLVGSLGRLGIITQATFKVFPRPTASLTISSGCDSHQQAVDRIREVARNRWELDAIDYRPCDRQLALRLNGPQEAIDALAPEIQSSVSGRRVEPDKALAYWRSITELMCISEDRIVVRVPTTTRSFLSIADSIDSMEADLKNGFQSHLSVAGNCLWVGVLPSQLDRLSEVLQRANLTGVLVRGTAPSLMIGAAMALPVVQRAAGALDPQRKFFDYV